MSISWFWSLVNLKKTKFSDRKLPKRAIKSKLSDASLSGSTYLSVYSQINGMTEHRIHDLSVTISLRNTYKFDTVYIIRAEYYNTRVDLIRSYLKSPIYLEPMETVEIYIEKKDQEWSEGLSHLYQWDIGWYRSSAFVVIYFTTGGTDQGWSDCYTPDIYFNNTLPHRER